MTNKQKIFLKLLFIVLIAGAVFIFAGPDREVYSGASDNVHGFAWSSNFGWISFNKEECNTNLICRDINTHETVIGNCAGAAEGDSCGAGRTCVNWCTICNNNPKYICDAGSDGTACPGGTCDDDIDYGVSIDGPNRNLRGYAWSSGAGWIYFERPSVCSNNSNIYCRPGDDSVCGGGTCSQVDPDALPDTTFNGNCFYPGDCDPASGCWGCVNQTNLHVYGWAKVLSLDDNGWVGLYDDDPDDSYHYGVTIDNFTNFHGYAWNKATPEIGVGWISFNCEDLYCSGDDNGDCFGKNAGDDCGSGTCRNMCNGVSSNYKVYSSGLAPTTFNASITRCPENFNGCSCLQVNWDETEWEEHFRIYRHTAAPVPLTPEYRLTNGGVEWILNENVTAVQDADPSKIANTVYYYRVEAYNSFGSVFNANGDISGRTDTVCVVNVNDEDEDEPFSIKGICPNSVQLDWDEPEHDLACIIDGYQVARCQCTDVNICDLCDVNQLIPSGNYSWLTLGGCVSDDDTFVNDTQCDDDNDSILPDNASEYYKYIIRAHCDDGTFSNWSAPTDKVQPCPPLPKWQEIKYR